MDVQFSVTGVSYAMCVRKYLLNQTVLGQLQMAWGQLRILNGKLKTTDLKSQTLTMTKLLQWRVFNDI